MRRNKFSRGLVIVITATMIMTMSSTAAMAQTSTAARQSSQETQEQVTALLGDLNDNVSTITRTQITNWVTEANSLMEAREANGNYVMTDKETALWNNINDRLDQETKRQFGSRAATNWGNESGVSITSSKVVRNLKTTLSAADYTKLKALLTKLNNANTILQYYQYQGQIMTLLGKYKTLDPAVTFINLTNAGVENGYAVFKITTSYGISYLNASKSGLTPISRASRLKYAKTWTKVLKIVPKSMLTNFRYFKLAGDGQYGLLAYVTNIDKEGKTWMLGVDPADVKDDGTFPYTVIHEMFHYVTLNNTQAEYTGKANNVKHSDYSNADCLLREDSYLDAFYEKFWEDIYYDWQSDTDDPYFYARHKDEFVDEYSSTACSEDIAETFSAYVLMDKADTAAEQEKFDFFDQYPELRQLKSEIRSNIEKNGIYVYPDVNVDNDSDFDYTSIFGRNK